MEKTKLKNLELILEAITKEEIFKSIRLISEQTSSTLIQEELVILKAAFHGVRKHRMIVNSDTKTISRIHKVLLEMLLEMEKEDAPIYLTKRERARMSRRGIKFINTMLKNNFDNLVNRLQWAFSMQHTSRLEYFLDSVVENRFLPRYRLKKWIQHLAQREATADKKLRPKLVLLKEKLIAYYLMSLEMKFQVSVLVGYLNKKESHYKYRNLNGKVNYLYQHTRLYLDMLIRKKRTYKKFRRFLKLVNQIEKDTLMELDKVVPAYQTKLEKILLEIQEITIEN